MDSYTHYSLSLSLSSSICLDSDKVRWGWESLKPLHHPFLDILHRSIIFVSYSRFWCVERGRLLIEGLRCRLPFGQLISIGRGSSFHLLLLLLEAWLLFFSYSDCCATSSSTEDAQTHTETYALTDQMDKDRDKHCLWWPCAHLSPFALGPSRQRFQCSIPLGPYLTLSVSIVRFSPSSSSYDYYVTLYFRCRDGSCRVYWTCPIAIHQHQ